MVRLARPTGATVPRRAAGGHVTQAGFDGVAVHLHGEVVESGGDESLFHLANGAGFLGFLE